MKESEIKVGSRYKNNLGTVREVVAEGAAYNTRYHPADDTVRYKVVTKGTRGGYTMVGEEYNCTREAFAKWAKEATNG